MEPLSNIVRKVKLRLLKMHFDAQVGHIGGNLSSLDLIMHLHHNVLKPNDIFVLSKGHSVGALYVTLWSLGRLTDEDLLTFHKDGTKLCGHPSPNWIPEIIFATGSLGHGLSLSAGLALAKKIKTEEGRIYCLMSDGEWNEGSNWEALIFIAHHKLDQLTFIVDHNRLQGFGSTEEVAYIEPISEKFQSFGIHTDQIDGHNLTEISDVFSKNINSPKAIVANTKKGHGVSFMENKMEWHYLPMTKEQYQQAMEEIEKS